MRRRKAGRIAGHGEGRAGTGARKYLLGKIAGGVPANTPRKEALDPTKFLAVEGFQKLISASVRTGRFAGRQGGCSVMLPVPGGIIDFVEHLSGTVALAHAGLRMMRARGGSVLRCAIPAPTGSWRSRRSGWRDVLDGWRRYSTRLRPLAGRAKPLCTNTFLAQARANLPRTGEGHGQDRE